MIFFIEKLNLSMKFDNIFSNYQDSENGLSIDRTHGRELVAFALFTIWTKKELDEFCSKTYNFAIR